MVDVQLRDRNTKIEEQNEITIFYLKQIQTKNNNSNNKNKLRETLKSTKCYRINQNTTTKDDVTRRMYTN